MRVEFVTAGDINWGSSRMRAYWPARHMAEAHVVTWAEMMRQGELPVAQAYIFQKNISVEIAELMAGQGAQVWWDVCDPAWWWKPAMARELSEILTGVVASSAGLARSYEECTGKTCHVIPDRLELSHFNRQREHGDVSPVRLIWFGISANRFVLKGAWPNLVRLQAEGHEIELTIMDERPDVYHGLGTEVPVTMAQWSLAREVDIIARHDIALLPPYPGPWGAVKSDNKALTACACGLPVISGFDYDKLARLVEDPEWRDLTGFEMRHGMEHDYHVRQSAADWLELLG